MASDYQKELLDYFRKNISKGYTVESLKLALLKQGYPKVAVDRAVKSINDELAKKAPILKEQAPATTEIITEDSEPVKKSFWRRLFGL